MPQQGHKGPRKKKLTDAKIRRAYEALEELTLCEDLSDHLDFVDQGWLIGIKNRLGHLLKERGLI